jgi:hypothetical protein
MADAISSFQTACVAKDFGAMAATLAPHVELPSPISGRMVFRGKADVSTLLAAGFVRLFPAIARHPGIVVRALRAA